MKPHKHAELIKQWADGAEIEVRVDSFNGWVNVLTPNWYEDRVYRVKPKPKWTPKYRLITAYADGIRMSVEVHKAVCNYTIIQQFVEDFETDWNNQDYEVFKNFNKSYYKVSACDTYPSLGAVRMSKQCAEKLCKMLNSGEIEL